MPRRVFNLARTALSVLPFSLTDLVVGTRATHLLGPYRPGLIFASLWVIGDDDDSAYAIQVRCIYLVKL
jgi:hypothetical protein